MEPADVVTARDRIRGRVRRTPLLAVEPGDCRLPAGGVLKLEHLQHTGSFKARGAVNRIVGAAERGELDPDVGIAIASGGNAGLANAYAAAALDVPATVFVPTTASPTKLRRLAEYGARVVRHGSEYADALGAAQEFVERTGAVHCHAYDQPDVCAGAGTLGLELLEQLDEVGAQVDTVLVAVGGGGLLAGVATALAGRVAVVGVEPATAPTLHAALGAGGPVDVAVSGVAADSLGARRLGAIAWDVVSRLDVPGVLVADDDIIDAQRALWEQLRLVVEPAAATPFAALRSGSYRPRDGERICVVVCGANCDPASVAPA